MNAEADAWIHAGRQRFGQPKMVARLDGVKPIIAAVRAGEPLYLLPDMNFDPSESLFVPFFGVSACTVPSLSRFAQLGRAQVVPIVTQMTTEGYRVQVLEAWADFPTEDLVQDTTRMNQELERYIAVDPSQYDPMERHHPIEMAAPPIKSVTSDGRIALRLQEMVNLTR